VTLRWFLRSLNLPLPEQDIVVREVREYKQRPKEGDKVMLLAEARIARVSGGEVEIENFKIVRIIEVIRNRDGE
jgi:hypothetical protein